jgi:hypothetical protein
VAEKKAAPVDDLADIKKAIQESIATGGSSLNYIGLPAGANTPTIDLQAVESAAQSGGIAKDKAGRLAPRYYAGYENAPVQESWPPELVSQLQTKLVQAGLLDTDYKDGWWDTASGNAFSEIIGHANNAGTDWQTALSSALNSAPMEIDPKTGLAVKRNPGAAKKSAATLHLLNPNDIAATANDIAVRRIGRGFSPDEMKKFVASYHAAERAGQGAATGGGEVVDPMAVDTAATDYAAKLDPVATQARNMLPLVDSISQLMKPQVTGVAEPLRSS